MPYVVMAINESWIWLGLGPLLLGCFGIMIVAVVVDLFSEINEEMRG